MGGKMVYHKSRRKGGCGHDQSAFCLLRLRTVEV